MPANKINMPVREESGKKVQRLKCKVQSAKCKVQSGKVIIVTICGSRSSQPVRDASIGRKNIPRKIPRIPSGMRPQPVASCLAATRKRSENRSISRGASSLPANKINMPPAGILLTRGKAAHSIAGRSRAAPYEESGESRAAPLRKRL